MAAVRAAEVGLAHQAREFIAESVKVGQGRDASALTALVAARVGNLQEAEQRSSALDKQYSSDTLIQQYWLPTIRASISLRQGKAEQAVEQLRPALTIEMATPASSVAMLYPAYVRGQAYLAAGNPTSAVAEFKKFMDHRGLLLNFPLASLAGLQLARACAAANDEVKEQQAYRDFLNLWKDADPEIPILKQAKSEFAKVAAVR